MKSTNYKVYVALVRYLETRAWSLVQCAEGRYSIHEIVHGERHSIVLPDESLVDHKQSGGMLLEAIEVIAEIEDTHPEIMKQLLINSDYDHFSLREFGGEVGDGTISLSSGLSVVSSIYDMFKYSASAAISIKGKRKVVAAYLAGLRLATPVAGSFIFNFDAFLYRSEDSNGLLQGQKVSSIGRLFNASFATRLQKVRGVVTSGQEDFKAELLRSGITSKYFMDLSGVFAPEATNIEFNFNWSFAELSSRELPKTVGFFESDKHVFQEYAKCLISSASIRLERLSAYVEACSRKEGDVDGRAHIRFSYDGKIFSVSILVGPEQYRLLNESHVAERKIFISGDLYYSEGSRTKIEAFHVTQIVFLDKKTMLLI